MAAGINVIFSITDLASSTLANVRSEMSRVASGITQASTALFFWSEAFNQIKAASSQFYNLFIGQNEQMRQQILATQSSLAAVQDVYINGVRSVNPTETIKAFEEPIKKSLNQIAIESLDLVGVTSGQLTDLLQISLTSASKITNQSKEFADPIKAAERLTLSFAGAFGAMQIPLFQARQEMTSILTGTIDMNSRLAKGLNITNEQVRAWSSQGVLVDKLIEKLQPFIAGNAMGARSISGITGNLKEILEITTRLAGENLTAIFVDGLDVIYQYLKSIQPQIQETFNNLTGFITNSVKEILRLIEPFLPSLEILRDSILSIGVSIGEIVGSSVQILFNLLEATLPILTPIFDVLVQIVKVVAELLGNPVIQSMLQIALIATTIVGLLTTAAGLVGTILAVFASGGSFFVLLGTIAPGLAASLTALGAALASIAGVGGAAAGGLAASGSGLAVLGGAIATVTAALAPLAAAIAAVAAAALLWQSVRLKDSREAIEEISSRSDATAAGATDTTLKLRQLRDAEIIQGSLTDKQKSDKESLQARARNYATQLEAEIAAAKAIDTAGDESLENAKKALIAGNEVALKSLGKFTSGLSTSAKPLTELGGIFGQLTNKVAAFEKQIKEANSDQEFQTANKGIIDLITKQVQLGQITAEQGKKRLNSILDDSRVEIATKESALKAISQLQEVTTKKELDRNQQAQSEIEVLQNNNLIGEVKAEQLLTEEKLKAVKIRSDSQKQAHAERMKQIQSEMNANLGAIDEEITQKQAALDKLKASKAPEVQVVQAQRDLDFTKAKRTSRQLEFGDIQIEEARKNLTETAKLDVERSKLEKQQRDIKNREILKDFEEREKINNAARDRGLKDNQAAANEAVRIAEERAKFELDRVKSKTEKLEAEAKKQGKTAQQYDKEAWEALQVQQAEALQKLANARKEGFEKKLSDIKQDAQESIAIVEAAQAKNDTDNQEAAAKTAAINTKSINQQIALIEKEIAASKGNKERLEELNAKKANLEKDLTEVQKKQLQQRLDDLRQDAEERTAVVRASNARGKIDNQQAAIETEKIESASSQAQLKLIQKRIAEVQAADKKRGKVSTELLEDLRKQEADVQLKITEIAKKAMDARLADLKEDVQERTAVVKAAAATGDIDNQAAAKQTAQIERKGAADRLDIIRKRIQQVEAEGKKTGKVNVELLENLKKQEAETQVEMTEIVKKEMESRLSDLQQDAEERSAVIQAANALGTKDNQEAAIETSKIQQESAKSQLKIVQERIKSVIEEGKKSGKVNTELLEELRKKEADIQVKITEIQKQELQKRLADLQQDADERIATVTAANANGILDNQQAAVKTARIQQDSLNEQLKLIRQRISTVNSANKELLEELRKQEADIQVKITEIQKQQLQKRLADLKEDAEEKIALIEVANASGVKDNQQSAIEIENIQKQSINEQLKLIQQRIATVGSKNKELSEELKAQEAKLQKELIEIQEQSFQKRLADLQQDSEERQAIENAAGAKGLADNQEIALKLANIQEESAQKQLALIRERLAQSTAPELREKLLKQEAETETKIIEIRKQSFDKRLSDLEQDGQEQQTVLEGQLAQGLKTESDFAQSRYEVSLKSIDAQLTLIRERRSQISATDIEGQEALASQEAALQKRRQDALSQFLEAQLSLLDRENRKATELLEQSELDRKLIVQKAALAGIADKDAAADASIQATKRRIEQEIALEEQKNATLRSLPAFSEPAKEAERQSRIRASAKRTTELRIQLLDEEKKAFDLLVDRQIKAIQNQAREQEIASDKQVKAVEQQIKQYDLLGKSLENQNKLLQSRGSLANALGNYIQGEYKILQDSATSEDERKRLVQQAANAQLVAMQQQQAIAQKNLEIEIKQAEIAQKRAEFEAEIAEIRARAGLAKADADVARAEANLTKVQRDPNASNADVEAARLDVVSAKAAAEAAVVEVAGAIANKELVTQGRDVLAQQNALKRETQSIEQATQARSAQAQAISAIADPNERKLAERELAGRLTPEERERLARVRQYNQQQEAIRLRDEAERNAMRGSPPTAPIDRSIRVAGARSASLLGEIQSPTAPKIPNLSEIVTQVRSQQQISPRASVDPMLKLQEASAGYQKDMVALLQQINAKPAPQSGQQVANNFNIKAEAGISEAQVLGVFGQVSQQVTQMLKR